VDGGSRCGIQRSSCLRVLRLYDHAIRASVLGKNNSQTTEHTAPQQQNIKNKYESDSNLIFNEIELSLLTRHRPLPTPKAASMGQDTHHIYRKQLPNIKQKQTRKFRNTTCDLLLSRPAPPSSVSTAPIVPRALGLLSNRILTHKTACNEPF
jgi:hypothetical protein